VVEIKFCGMTRPEDARHAALLGARYVGVILASGPRKLSDDAARVVLAAVPRGMGRVGVFAAAPPEEIVQRAEQLALTVVQLHGEPTPETIARVRARWSGDIWAVRRLEGANIPDGTAELFDVADAVLLDARVEGALGGTGVTLPWAELHARVAAIRPPRSSARLVLAGGLRPENVAQAVAAMHPDVVDVSSGVESNVGVKDHARMRAFRDAATSIPEQ
jgi:phosphoribosylanthranilate isomerase